MDPEDVPVAWEVARDPRFERGVARGVAAAAPEHAHSVHVTVGGLDPGREYWYRFRALGHESSVGRTRTLPRLGLGRGDELRLVTCCCQHWEQGYFTAYAGVVADDPHLVLHLGDAIYEVDRGGVRLHARPGRPEALDDYRVRHALYRTDPHLQAARAAVPFVETLDNHDAAEEPPRDEASRHRRAAAYQAWVEHTPMRRVPERFDQLRLHTTLDLGQLARIEVLDTRQFRARQHPCGPARDPAFGFGIYRRACEATAGLERSMLGVRQSASLGKRLSESTERWSVLASTVLWSPFEMVRGGDRHVYDAAWDGYPAERTRLQESWLASESARVVLSGDLHSTWAIDVPGSRGRPFAAELLAPSISSGWPEELDRPIRENLARNPHVQHYRAERGYLLHRVDPRFWRSTARTLDATDPSARVGRGVRCTLEAGRSGLAEVSEPSA